MSQNFKIWRKTTYKHSVQKDPQGTNENKAFTKIIGIHHLNPFLSTNLQALIFKLTNILIFSYNFKLISLSSISRSNAAFNCNPINTHKWHAELSKLHKYKPILTDFFVQLKLPQSSTKRHHFKSCLLAPLLSILSILVSSTQMLLHYQTFKST